MSLLGKFKSSKTVFVELKPDHHLQAYDLSGGYHYMQLLVLLGDNDLLLLMSRQIIWMY